jgi:precorrin-4/cobalt-precorrin-4 C11-methyltransferase
VVVARASWPDQEIVRGTLATIAGEVQQAGIDRTALILVGPTLGSSDFRESALYSVDYQRRYRGR